MEETWIQRVRNIAKQQAANVVDGQIVDHRMQLKRRDGQVIDAGPIKVKTPGAVVAIGYTVNNTEPDIYVSKDGAVWQPAASESKYQGGTDAKQNNGCYTGDRFMVPVYAYDDYSGMLQSRDGGTWAFHPDRNIFMDGVILGMDASGEGAVVAVGDLLGPDGDAVMAVSRDFGETWELVYPPSGPVSRLGGVCCKNEREWVVSSEYDFTHWYTWNGGFDWVEVDFPPGFEPANNFYYACAIRYFNGYWWAFGQGYGADEWDTPLVKSEDLVVWVPVMTPWTGYYPGAILINQDSYIPPDMIPAYPDPPYHVDNSGTIVNLEYDMSTNTAICTGTNQYNDTKVMMSTDGGINWFEVGWEHNANMVEDYGWVGIYKWPSGWNFTHTTRLPLWDFYEGGGMAFGYNWWFLSNNGTSPDSITPSMIRISPDGQITEPVYPATQFGMATLILLSGGDRNF